MEKLYYQQILKHIILQGTEYFQDLKGFPLVVTKQDVVKIVKFLHANINSIDLCVMCGGHSSQAYVDDAFVIDLLHLDQTEFVESSGVIHVGGGAYLKNIDEALAPLNRIVPVDTYQLTGVGGLALGGGFGWLSKMFGLTVDNFLEAEVVLFDGSVVIANDSNEYSDLIWGLRGGGGNFGIVTRFTFQSHQLPKHCLGGFVTTMAPSHSMTKGVVLRLDRAIKDCPKNLTYGIVLPGGAPVVNSIKKRSFHTEVQNFTKLFNPNNSYSYHTIIPVGSLDEKLSNAFVDTLIEFKSKSLPLAVYDAVIIMFSFSCPDFQNIDPSNTHTAVSPVVRNCRYFVLIEAHYKPESDPTAKGKAKAWVKDAVKVFQPLQNGKLCTR
eukprot:gene14382-19299_t